MNQLSSAGFADQSRRAPRPGMAARLAASVLAGALVLSSAVATNAQTANPRDGVSLDGVYRGGGKVKLMVDFVKGAAGDSVTEIITRDLRNSDRFEVLPSGSAPGLTGPINYPLFAQLGAQGVIEATVLPSGTLHVELYDVPRMFLLQKQDFLLSGAVLKADWRMGVHGVSDQIEQWITGERGIAQSRIAFVRDRRVWMVDSDGANAAPVTSVGLSPSWAPNGRTIVYNINAEDSSPIMLMDVATGALKALTSGRSTSAQDYAPAVTKDGRTVIFARILPGGTDLYSVPVTGGTPQRLTNGRGKASGSPSPSPDGLRMAFSSDRAGNQDVYVSDADGSNPELLTNGGVGERNWRDLPDWSPDGRLVAYQSGVAPSFQIMTINVRDQTTRFITSEGKNTEPSWAPDSRHLVVSSSRGGSQQLWIIDSQSGTARQLTRGSLPRMPAWSPRLSGTP
ncbi:MAG: hypothetical protein ABI852_03825 [Gemmatimonadaceae bacterium]